MTPRERVLAVFEGRMPDRVPVFHAGFSSRVGSSILGISDAHVGGGINQWREAVALWNGPDAHAEYEARCFQDAMALTERLDLDLVRDAYWRRPIKPDQRIDEYTFLYGDPDGNRAVYQLDPHTELFQLVDKVPARESVTLDDLARAVESAEAGAERYAPTAEAFALQTRTLEYFKGERAVRAGGVGINIDYKTPAWIEAVALAPELVGRLLLAQAVRGEKNVDAAHAAGIRIMQGGGDFASNKGPFYSPRSYEALWTPAIKRVTARCHANGMFHKYASDGNLWPVADALFPHVDGFYELDELAGMDLKRLREIYPHLVLLGGVNSQTLHEGPVEKIVDEVERAMAVAHEYGGVIVGVSNQVVPPTPPEHFWAMQDTIDRLR